MTDSFEKWPAEIRISMVVSSVLDREMSLYFVTGLMNKKQYTTLKEKMPIMSDFQVDDKRWVVATLLTHQQLSDAYNAYTSLAKTWRGQYYVITNKFVSACKPYMDL